MTWEPRVPYSHLFFPSRLLLCYFSFRPACRLARAADGCWPRTSGARPRPRFAHTVFSTNAIKVTVSVLYWYEELSSSSGNFWERSSDLFFISGGISPLSGSLSPSRRVALCVCVLVRARVCSRVRFFSLLFSFLCPRFSLFFFLPAAPPPSRRRSSKSSSTHTHSVRVLGGLGTTRLG